MYRTLVNIIDISIDTELGQIFEVIIPSWSEYLKSRIPVSDIPNNMVDYVISEFTCGNEPWLICKVNIQETQLEYLVFGDWEMPPKLMSWDEL